MNVLLTGSSGWLGRFVAPLLRAEGYSVIGLDVVPGPDTDVVGSVADRPLLERILSCNRVGSVIHTAALHKPDIQRFPAQAFVDVNVTGTLHLLELATAAGADRFIFTSTTSLMISSQIRDESGNAAVWLDEAFGPLAPRNIYGVTKLAAEGLCRMYHLERGLNCIVLRTGRFFPEEDDTHRHISGPNLKANEFLHRRLSVEDAAQAHLSALRKAPELGFDLFLLSAPTPFSRSESRELMRNAQAVVSRHFPGAAELYAKQGWTLPESIGRVYDSSRSERVLGFTYETDFSSILTALGSGAQLPFTHDPNYVSPQAGSLVR